jgi:hypothetical protein
LPPREEAPGELAILAARSLDIPLSFSASYCFSFLTFAFLLGMPVEYPARRGRNDLRLGVHDYVGDLGMGAPNALLDVTCKRVGLGERPARVY